MNEANQKGRSALRFIVVCLVCAAASAASAAEAVTATPIVEAHNQVRQRHGLPPLAWSPRLARGAASWADHLANDRGCRLDHSSGEEGENLFWASAKVWSDGRVEKQAVTALQVVGSWAAEQADYDYATNRCRAGKGCGHYTQIVWATTTHVGCGMAICKDLAQVWVCRYSPAGNIVGERPY